MAIITHPHYKKTYTRNGRMLRSSTPTLSSADRVSYGQGCGAAGSVFRVNEATGCSTLFKPSVAKMGTGTIAVCTGVFHVTETGIGNDSSRYSFSADGVAAGAGPRAQSLTASRGIAMGADFCSMTSAEFAGDTGHTGSFHFIPFAHDQACQLHYEN